MRRPITRLPGTVCSQIMVLRGLTGRAVAVFAAAALLSRVE